MGFIPLTYTAPHPRTAPAFTCPTLRFMFECWLVGENGQLQCLARDATASLWTAFGLEVGTGGVSMHHDVGRCLIGCSLPLSYPALANGVLQMRRVRNHQYGRCVAV